MPILLEDGSTLLLEDGFDFLLEAELAHLAGLSDIHGCRVAIQVTGSFTGTLYLEGSNDGSTWVAVAASPLGNAASSVTSFTTAGMWLANCTGVRYLRCRADVSDGTYTVVGRAVATA